MSNCLNILNDPAIFISTAALIVVVLLVWTQLTSRGDVDKDFNLVCGITWTYSAILFVLVASALRVLQLYAFAKSFLILSFLMTVFNLALAISLTIVKIVFSKPFSESLTKVGKDCKKRFIWSLYWLFVLVGLCFISFTCVLESLYFGLGIAVFILANIVAIIIMFLNYRHRLYTYIKFYLWRMSRKISSLCKNKNEKPTNLTKHPHPGL